MNKITPTPSLPPKNKKFLFYFYDINKKFV